MPDLTELRRLLDVATPQPWTATYEAEDDWHAITGSGYDDGGQWMVCPEVSTSFGSDDANLIVAAVNALPDLLDAAEALERVKALHYTHECVPLDFRCVITFGGGCAAVGTCTTCGVRYPCPTIRAIDGEPQP